jgi:hypothetical protein
MADAPETPAEAKARRRRWLTLAEIATVITLAISVATFWDNHQQRAEERAEKAAAAKVKPAIAPLVLTAKPEDDGNKLVLSANRDRIIQSQTLSFPTALDVSPVDIVGNARIEADWFASGLRDALGDKRERGRVPVAIVTTYIDDGTERTDTAIYDIGHDWRSRLLASDVPVLEGITLVSRGDKDVQGRLDARWAKLHPAEASK